MRTSKFVVSIIVSALIGPHAYAGGENITNAAAGAVTGVMMFSTAANMNQGKKFTEKCSGAWVYCGMAVLAFAQAAMSLKGAKESNKVEGATECFGPYCNGGNGGTIDPSTGYPPGFTAGGGTLPPGVDPITGGTLPPGVTQDDVLGRIQDDVNQHIADLKDKGYSYDSSTNSVNTPNGKIAASTFGSSDGLKSLGMSDDEVRNAQKIAQDALKKASKFAGSSEYGGGGGSKINPGPGYDKDSKGFDMNKYIASLRNKNKNTRGVAGLEKKYGTDQIGVAQDDIFKMIHRRYQAKKSSLTP